VSFEGFPTAGAFTRTRLADANRTARQLNHDLEEWKNAGKTWGSKCKRCGDRATVRQKGVGGVNAAEIGGPATVFYCTKSASTTQPQWGGRRF
jgi:hypothetical protein